MGVSANDHPIYNRDEVSVKKGHTLDWLGVKERSQRADVGRVNTTQAQVT